MKQTLGVELGVLFLQLLEDLHELLRVVPRVSVRVDAIWVTQYFLEDDATRGAHVL